MFAGALACGAAISLSVVAEEAKRVDFTVRETLPTVTQGKIVKGALDGCPSPVIRTTHGGSSQSHGAQVFNGSKKVDCGAGNTLTLAFRVSVSDCDGTNSGVWEVKRGTGIFAKAKGGGKLVGTYTLGNGRGSFCEADGLLDHYTGRLAR
jgi:hypothetical protein